MQHFALRAKQPYRALPPRIAVELLEKRQLLSASLLTALDATPSPVAALSVNANVGKRFNGAVGSWTNPGGLPAKGSGVTAIAIVSWGDGRSSRGKFVDDGSGVVQILASHAWIKAGTFQTVVKVEEFPKGHPGQLTVIGEGDGSAVVAPKPQPFSVKGTITGTFTTPLGNPDARNYVFTGAGTAGALGAADLSGSISPPGFIKSAPATGDLTLTGATGSVTIHLTGQTQPGGSPLPQKMAYVVTGGTGAFANAGGKGTVSIALDTTASTFVMVIH